MTSVSSASNAVGSVYTSYVDNLAKQEISAESTIAMICMNDEVIAAITERSALYFLPEEGSVIPVLWGAFTEGDKITKADVERTVMGLGGTRKGAALLWDRLDPNDNGSVNAVDYINNLWLAGEMEINLPAIKDAVMLQLLTSGPAVPDALSMFTSVGGSGSLISGLGANSNFINVFV